MEIMTIKKENERHAGKSFDTLAIELYVFLNKITKRFNVIKRRNHLSLINQFIKMIVLPFNPVIFFQFNKFFGFTQHFNIKML